MVALYQTYADCAYKRSTFQGPWGNSYEVSPAEKTATDFLNRALRDPNHAFEREVSAKAFREYNRNQNLVDGTIISLLPYKSLADVDANNYDDTAVKMVRAELAEAIKSNELDNTGQSGFGLEWVPTIWNSTLWRRVRIANPVAGSFAMIIEMPTNPYNLPIETTDPTAYAMPEATDMAQLAFTSGNVISVSKIASDKKSITAKKLGTRVGFSAELVEDSIIPILPAYRYQVTRVLQNFVDDTIINGDTATTASTNINLIDGTPGTNVSYLLFDGMRKYCLITNTGQLVDFASGPTLGSFRTMRSKLNRHYQMDSRNLMYVVNPETALKMLSMPEVATAINLNGPASNVTGTLPMGNPDQVEDVAVPFGQIDGSLVYVSAQIGQAQAGAIASHGGEISQTASNNTTGTAILYHKSRTALGYRRHIQLDIIAPNQAPLSDTYQLWATVRFGITTFDTTSIVTGYDITN
jgi:HK97 family phage major capsid protein